MAKREWRLISKILEDVMVSIGETYQWYAVRTKYKCEKYVANALYHKGVNHYLPLVKVTKKYIRKVKTYNLPLLNCFVFVYINRNDYVKVLQTEYVFGFLRIGMEISPVKEEEITLLRKITGEYNEIKVETLNLTEGSPVEIISGNLIGTKGILTEKRSKKSFVVRLDSIGYQLQIQVDPSQLVPLTAVLGH